MAIEQDTLPAMPLGYTQQFENAMNDFNAHLSIASFAMVGLLIIAITFNTPRHEVTLIAVAIISYVISALIWELIKEKKMK